MKSRKFVWNSIAIGIAIVLYVMLLIYISSIQSDYSVCFETDKETYTFQSAAESYTIPIKITNHANRTMNSALKNMFVSYHIYNESGELLIYDNIRTPFPKTLYPGDKESLELQVSKIDPGTYILEIDMLQEGVEWFSDQEEMTKRIQLVVE